MLLNQFGYFVFNGFSYMFWVLFSYDEATFGVTMRTLLVVMANKNGVKTLSWRPLSIIRTLFNPSGRIY